MKIKKAKRPPTSRWSMRIEESYKGCQECDRYVSILFDGKIVMYVNYALGKYRDMVAKRLVSALRRAEVITQLPEFNDYEEPIT